MSNLCRILTTTEEGEIISKAASLTRWRDRLPERWRPLLAEAWRIRYALDQPSFYRSRFQRMREMLAFIQYGRQRGGQALTIYL
ncbi:MAG TPA: aminoglycoside adenylyltransferase domain-containing protein [Ktedonobacteraceae bacterium]|nr:aminoglycoside adenylyltransferase domain-containing protein [Ktedonobacteraceae bacterium]